MQCRNLMTIGGLRRAISEYLAEDDWTECGRLRKTLSQWKWPDLFMIYEEQPSDVPEEVCTLTFGGGDVPYSKQGKINLLSTEKAAN